MNIVIKQKDRDSNLELHGAYETWREAFKAAEQLSESGDVINATIFSFSNELEFGGENRIKANWINGFIRSDKTVSAPSGDCALCTAGDAQKGGGIFWTDDVWICSECWHGLADSREKATASAAAINAQPASCDGTPFA